MENKLKEEQIKKDEAILFADFINKEDYEKIHGNRWCQKYMSFTLSTDELYAIFKLNQQVRAEHPEFTFIFSQADNNEESPICKHCGKYKRMQGNGMVHQLCECGTT